MFDPRRREFITLLGGAATAWPLAARAQQGERVRRLVAMMGGRNADTDPEGRAWFVAFRKALEDLGWVEGRNFRADYRWPSGDIDRIEVIAKEFIDLKPDGSFRTRQLLLGWDNVPMHRWAQAQLFRSLCCLLLQSGQPASSCSAKA